MVLSGTFDTLVIMQNYQMIFCLKVVEQLLF